MIYSIYGCLSKYYGCTQYEEGITLYSVIESEAQIIYIDCSLLDENTIDVYELIENITDYCLI